LRVERKQATKKAEEKFLQHIQKVLTELHKEIEIGIIKSEENSLSPNKTKKEYFVNHINITHQGLEEGINNTFILENSIFLYEEKKEGSCVGRFTVGSELVIDGKNNNGKDQHDQQHGDNGSEEEQQ
jgi:hypothetical protein